MKNQEWKAKGTPVQFNAAKEMLDYILDGFDLYNPEEELYVFEYNTKGSICSYSGIDVEKANELDEEMRKTGQESWSTLLDWRGSAIHDSKEKLLEFGDEEPEDENLLWCEENYNKTGWFNIMNRDLTLENQELNNEDYEKMEWKSFPIGEKNMIKQGDRAEFIGQIMDVFEDFLDSKGISFPETGQLMLDAGCSREEVEENNVVLYGENYSQISDRLEELLVAWNVLENPERTEEDHNEDEFER